MSDSTTAAMPAQTMADVATGPARVCHNCVNCWDNGTGWSDWTWLDTYRRCFLGLNPPAIGERRSGMTAEDEKFAQTCQSFRLSKYPVPTICPEGEILEPGRFAEIPCMPDNVRSESK